jgi:hypothetical protein
MAAKKKVPAKKVAPAKGKKCPKCGKMGSACKC